MPPARPEGGPTAGAEGAALALVGVGVRPHGVRGEVRFTSLSGIPGRFHPGLDVVWRGRGRPDRPLTIRAAREADGTVHARFDQVPDRTAAEALAGGEIWASVETSPPLEEGTYYHHQLLGMTVTDEAGRELGRLVAILPGAHDNYEVEMPDGRRFMVPAVAQFVQAVHVAERRMVIRPIPGLLPEAPAEKAPRGRGG